LAHAAVAVPRALIAGWRLYHGAEEKVTIEIAFQPQALSAGADASFHRHPASPSSQGAPGGADRSTCREKQRKGADITLIGGTGQERGKYNCPGISLTCYKGPETGLGNFFPLICKYLFEKRTHKPFGKSVFQGSS